MVNAIFTIGEETVIRQQLSFAMCLRESILVERGIFASDVSQSDTANSAGFGAEIFLQQSLRESD